MSEKIIKTEYSDVMQKSYIDYSMSVITARALPDIRDGLKPVQRRVLYAMDQLGLNYDKPHRKSARIVGDAMGKYHPHGDSSIYETLVVLSQDFKKGMALVDGHGNFGSIEGDGAAAMRYTEAKLKKFTKDVFLSDLDKNVIDFIPNFDGTETEPEVLPVRVPNILVNGADGIAVGMATNIPTHNLSEVIDAIIYYFDNTILKNGTAELSDILNILPGPDFPTGGIVINKSDLYEIYNTGMGKIKLRGKIQFEQGKGREKDRLIITEIPYTMIGNNITKFMSDVADLIDSKQASEITDISNESSKDGIRIVLELKKNADIDYLTNLLYKKTKLEDTFGVNMLATVNGRPETLSLLEIFKHFTDFQIDINKRKYTTLLEKELINKEIKEGLIKAVDCIDLIIEILRGSKKLEDAKQCLINGVVDNITFKTKKSMEAAKTLLFTEKQAEAILSMRLYRLIGLELEQLHKEYDKCLKDIATYEKILSGTKEIINVIKKDLEKIKKEYGYERRTLITDAKEAVVPEREIPTVRMHFLMDRLGYVRMIDGAIYDKNADTVISENKFIYECLNTDTLVIFTDKGNAHRVAVNDIPFTKLKEKGVPIDNISRLVTAEEDVVYITTARELEADPNGLLLFITANGLGKKVEKTEFIVTKKLTAATKLNAEDKLVSIIDISNGNGAEAGTATAENKATSDTQLTIDIAISGNKADAGFNATNPTDARVVTLKGSNKKRINFNLSEIPVNKKGAAGVICVKLTAGNTVVEAEVKEPDARLKIVKRGGNLT